MTSRFCAWSGGLRKCIYCVQKLWTADSCTPYHSKPHSLPRQGNRHCYGAIEHLILGYVLGIKEIFFLRAWILRINFFIRTANTWRTRIYIVPGEQVFYLPERPGTLHTWWLSYFTYFEVLLTYAFKWRIFIIGIICSICLNFWIFFI